MTPASGSVTASFNTAAGSQAITAAAAFAPAGSIAVGGWNGSPLTATYGSTGAIVSIPVTGNFLTDVINVAAQTGFDVSSDGSNFGSTATLPAAGGTLYVRLSLGDAPGIYDSTLAAILSSTGAPNVNLTQNVTTDTSGNAVSKATPSVVIDQGYYFFNGSPQGPTTYTTSPSGPLSDTGTPTWTYVGTGGTVYAASPTLPTVVGTYSATVSLAADANYNAASSSATPFTIGDVGNGVWTYNGNDKWSNPNSWLNYVVGSGAGNTASFTSGVFDHARTVTLDTSRTLGALIMQEGKGLTIQSSGGSTLTFDNNGSHAQVTMLTGTGGNLFLSTPVLLKDSLDISNAMSSDSGKGIYFTDTVTNNSANPVTISNLAGGKVSISGNISDGGNGAVSVVQAGGGNGLYAMILSGANTYTGGTTVSNGTLTFSGFQSQPSTGTLAISGGATVNLNSLGAATATTSAVAVTGAGTLNVILSGGYGNANTNNYDMSGFTGTMDISGSGRLLMQEGSQIGNPGPNFVSPDASAKIIVENGTTAYLGWQGTTTLLSTVQLNGTADDGEHLGQLRVENDAWQTGNVILNANSTIGSDSGAGYIYGVISEIGGSRGFTKEGRGALVLANDNTYTGTTTVSAGTLYINGSTASGLVTVASGATLGGSGTIGGATTIQSGGIYSPGTLNSGLNYPPVTPSPGTLTQANGLTISSGGIFNWNNTAVNAIGTAGTDWAVAHLTGGSLTLDTGSKLQLSLNAGTDFTNSFWDTNRTWNFITGGVSMAFDPANISILINGIQQGSSNTIAGQGTFTTVVSGSDEQLVWTAAQTAYTYNTYSTVTYPGIGGVTLNPAADGFSNQIKYLLGLDPTVNESATGAGITYSIQGGAGNQHNRLVFTRPGVHNSHFPSEATVGYKVQVSDDLATWADITIPAANGTAVSTPTTSGAGTYTISISGSGSSETETVTVDDSTSGVHRFIRFAGTL